MGRWPTPVSDSWLATPTPGYVPGSIPLLPSGIWHGFYHQYEQGHTLMPYVLKTTVRVFHTHTHTVTHTLLRPFVHTHTHTHTHILCTSETRPIVCVNRLVKLTDHALYTCHLIRTAIGRCFGRWHRRRRLVHDQRSMEQQHGSSRVQQAIRAWYGHAAQQGPRC